MTKFTLSLIPSVCPTVYRIESKATVDMEKVSTDSNDEKSCLQKIGRNKLLGFIALLVIGIVIITVVILVIFHSHQEGKPNF